MTTETKAATKFTRAAQRAVRERLPFSDTEDFELARRGFIATIPDGVVRNEQGRALWNLQALSLIHI